MPPDFSPDLHAAALLRGEATNQSLLAPSDVKNAAFARELDETWVDRVLSLGVTPEWAHEARERVNAQTERFREFVRQTSGAGSNAERVRAWRERNPDLNRARNVEYQSRYRAKHSGDPGAAG